MQSGFEILTMVSVGVLAMLVLALAVIFFVVLYYQRGIKTRLELETLRRQQAEERVRVITDTQEAERKRISVQLHDEVGASLSSINILLGRLRLKWPGECPEIVGEANSQLNTVIGEIRNIVQNISPALVERFGYLEAVGDICYKLNKTGLFKASFENRIPNDKTFKDKSSELMLYRITQELSGNVLKHSKADNVAICAEIKDDFFILSMFDDGIGFDADSASSKKSLGLANIRSRVEALDGTFSIRPYAEKGTAAIVKIPLDKLFEL
jgi:signal transduction histidine kinase